MAKRLVLVPRDELAFVRLTRETAAELRWQWKPEFVDSNPSRKFKYLRNVRKRRSYAGANELLDRVGLSRQQFQIVLGNVWRFGYEAQFRRQNADWAMESYYLAVIDRELAPLSDAEVERRLLVEVL